MESGNGAGHGENQEGNAAHKGEVIEPKGVLSSVASSETVSECFGSGSTVARSDTALVDSGAVAEARGSVTEFNGSGEACLASSKTVVAVPHEALVPRVGECEVLRRLGARVATGWLGAAFGVKIEAAPTLAAVIEGHLSIESAAECGREDLSISRGESGEGDLDVFLTRAGALPRGRSTSLTRGRLDDVDTAAGGLSLLGEAVGARDPGVESDDV